MRKTSKIVKKYFYESYLFIGKILSKKQYDRKNTNEIYTLSFSAVFLAVRWRILITAPEALFYTVLFSFR
jgi:hypothetical protein